MTNVGEERLFFFSGSVHDRGLYLECVILIALKKNTSSGSHRNLIPISLMM